MVIEIAIAFSSNALLKHRKLRLLGYVHRITSRLLGSVVSEKELSCCPSKTGLNVTWQLLMSSKLVSRGMYRTKLSGEITFRMEE